MTDALANVVTTALAEPPCNIDNGRVVLNAPLENIYSCASAIDCTFATEATVLIVILVA